MALTSSYRRATLAAAVAGLVLLTASSATAQGGELRRFDIGVGFLNTQPLGSLQTGPGWGLGLAGSYALDADHRFRIRGDLRMAAYGWDDRRVCLSQTVGCWIQVDINTSYHTFYGGIGPELALPFLGSELVLSATGGVGYFGVSSSLEGVDQADESFGETNHFDDAFFAWSAGGDLHVPVSRVLAVAIGIHYQRNGQASYVLEGGITENPDGTLKVAPITSDANMLALTVGVRIRPLIERASDERDI